MQYAKINNNTLLEYPYTWLELYKENSSSTYDDRFSLPQWYSQTEEAANTGNKIVEVLSEDPPEIDFATQHIRQESVPSFNQNEDKWVFAWIVTAKTAEEISDYQTQKNKPRTD